MAKYSHTKISTFEQCRYKYKLKYIDRIRTDRKTIEAFMGSMVHETLEKLYVDLGYKKRLSENEVLALYNEKWNEGYTEDILIAKTEYTSENYRLMGEDYIRMYYQRFSPFDQMTILGLETQDVLDLGNDVKYDVRIDKLACVGNTYYICDYKTENRMKTQEDADNDRQLAMYSKWVKETYPDAEKIFVLWHMLKFNKDVQTERTSEQIDDVVKRTLSSIKEIEACHEWPTSRSALCDYCDCREFCPEFRHLTEIEDLDPVEFSKDDGVKLVDEYARINKEIKDLKVLSESVEKDLIEFSKQRDSSVIYGTENKVSIRSSKKVEYPDKDALESTLMKKGIYENYVSFSTNGLTTDIKKGSVDDDILGLVKIDTVVKATLSKRKDDE